MARLSLVMVWCSAWLWGCDSDTEESLPVTPPSPDVSPPVEFAPAHEAIAELAIQFVMTPRSNQGSLLCPEDREARTPKLLDRLPPERRVPVEVEEDEVDSEVTKVEILPDGALVFLRFGGGVGNTLRDVVRIQEGPGGDCVVHGFAQLADLEDAMEKAWRLEEDEERVEAIAVLVEATNRVADARVVNFDMETRIAEAMEDLLRLVSHEAETLRTRDYAFDKALELLANTRTRLSDQRLRWRELGEDMVDVTDRLERVEEVQLGMRKLQTNHLRRRPHDRPLPFQGSPLDAMA